MCLLAGNNKNFWFHKFSRYIKEQPLPLVFDGHVTHVSLNVIQKALDDNIIILKFPSHATDILQPLDVSCFGPIKRRWEELLQERINLFAARSQLIKGDFVDHLCKIWRESLHASKIISGFSSTGS